MRGYSSPFNGLGSVVPSPEMTGRPNLLWLFCDQLRYHALACNGDRNVATPNLDRLAAEGVRCTHAVSHYPVCMTRRHTYCVGPDEPFRLLFDNEEDELQLCNLFDRRSAAALQATLHRRLCHAVTQSGELLPEWI